MGGNFNGRPSDRENLPFASDNIPDNTTNQNGETPEAATDNAANGQMPDGNAPPNGVFSGQMPDGDAPPSGGFGGQIPDGNASPNGGFGGQIPDGNAPPSGDFGGQMPDGNTPPSGFGDASAEGFAPPDSTNSADETELLWLGGLVLILVAGIVTAKLYNR